MEPDRDGAARHGVQRHVSERLLARGGHRPVRHAADDRPRAGVEARWALRPRRGRHVAPAARQHARVVRLRQDGQDLGPARGHRREAVGDRPPRLRPQRRVPPDRGLRARHGVERQGRAGLGHPQLLEARRRVRRAHRRGARRQVGPVLRLGHHVVRRGPRRQLLGHRQDRPVRRGRRRARAAGARLQAHGAHSARARGVVGAVPRGRVDGGVRRRQQQPDAVVAARRGLQR
mmetsp:Transcript_11766/g.36565  ORF Transcript_11766/g.36565 Transcript_11766/m.36565 type:complete len:232 (+) Transcript_11766:693-1388(+)